MATRKVGEVRVDWSWSPAGPVALLSAPALGALAMRVWRRKPGAPAGSLGIVLLGVCWWSVCYALELHSTEDLSIRFFGDLKYVGILLLGPAYLVFALHSTGRKDVITPRRLAALAVAPALTLTLLANEATHDLIRIYPRLHDGSPVTLVAPPLFWVHLVYSHVLVLVASCLLIAPALRARRPGYRIPGQLGVLALAIYIVSTVLHAAGVKPFAPRDLMPFGMLVKGFLLTWGVVGREPVPLGSTARDAVVQGTSDAVVVVDTGQRIVDLNPAARTLLGPSRIGYAVGAVLPELSPLLGDHDERECTRHRIRVGAAERDFDLALSALRDPWGRPSGHVLVLREVTADGGGQGPLLRLPHEDPLTGLANPALLLERLEATVRTSRPFGLLFCDIDRFQRVNETLGHEAGDRVLQHVAARLAGAVPDGTTLARFASDEFVVLLPDLERGGDLHALANHVVSVLGTPVLAGSQELYLTMSVGACRYPEGGKDGRELLRYAAAAAQLAKQAGRDRVASCPPDDGRAALERRERLRLERDLHREITRNLELWYQPITSLDSGRCLGLEALLRWRHPERGLLGADLFVPLAEQSGLISHLGTWALREACAQSARWRRMHALPLFVAVNVSARQIERGLPSQVAQILAETGAQPGSLTLEITESAVLHDEAGARRVLAQLSELGVRIATDDFGAGHTSLAQLRTFPLDVLKIDRSFVRGLDQPCSSDGVIVPALVSLAHDLGLSVVAEGVETARQRDRLRACSCDAGQGFLFSRPLDVDSASAYLASALPSRES